MPITCNSLLQTKTVKIENQNGSKGVYLYYDSFDEIFKTSMVNPDPDALPDFEGFSFDSANKGEFIAGESITNVYIYLMQKKIAHEIVFFPFSIYHCRVMC